jgi:hypothetical protein
MTIHVKTRVLAGNRIEVKAEGLREGEDVEVTIKPVEGHLARTRDIVDFIKSLPPSSKTPQEWEQFETEFREERDS